MVAVNIKHPYYEMDLERALAIATRLHPNNDVFPSPSDYVPPLEEACELVHHERRTCGFQWITGRVAEEVLRAAAGESNPFTA